MTHPDMDDRRRQRVSNRDLRVALVHDWLTGMRGGEKCLEWLCRQFPNADLFTLLYRRGAVSPTIERMRITTSFLERLPAVYRYYRYLLPLMPRAVESLSLPADVDLVVSLSHAVAKGVRVPRGVPHVCYCFTPMRYAWHLREDYFGPRSSSGGLRGSDGRQSAARRGPLALARDLLLDRVRRWDQKTSGRPTHYVAISRTVADRIQACYGRPSTVIYPPVDVDYFSPADVAREDYYVCFSALVPYKKVELAVQACNRLARRLVVIGDGPQRGQLEQLAGPTVRFLGHLPDDEVRAQLRRCRALLFPGLEDFGIVPVEAQACGTPVIAFGQGGATETVIAAAEDRVGTGLFFTPQTVDALADAIGWLEGHPEQFTTARCRRQAALFSTDHFQQAMLDYLNAVLERGYSPDRSAVQAPAAGKQAA